MAALTIAVVAAVVAGPAAAGDQIARGPAPSWVAAMEPSTAAASSDASTDGVRLLLLDMQYRSDGAEQSHYLRTRSVSHSPQGLAILGNVGLVWSPATQDVLVHHVNIIRGDEVIDVLAGQDFETLRREENLDQAMLDGRLTALLQPAGLRVGDMVDVAYTITTRDPVVGGHAEQAVDLNLPLSVDQMRYRASWPVSQSVAVQAHAGWTALPIRRARDYASVEVRRDHAQPIMVPLDVPGRFRRPNLIELSAYRDWGEVALTMKPLYDRTRRLEPESPLHAEIERIRALSDDPAVQALAALRLVQDQVRYVALMMGEGALTPASADETWRRRFGDCKGKTVLLLALLDGLGIAAEPAAVSLVDGDGMNERLPRISAFDHVLVRAVIGDEIYWMDGTRVGHRTLADLAPPPLHWALPLTGSDARLEALRPSPLLEPQSDVSIAMDASAGLHAPAAITGVMTLRSDTASLLAGQLGLVSSAQKEQALRANWTSMLGELSFTDVGSTYDADTSILTLTMTGAITLRWSGDSLTPPGSTYLPFSTEARPEGPFASAPFAVSHPAYSVQTVTLKLPEGGRGFRVAGGRFDRTELGYHASRTVDLEGDLVTIRIAMRSLVDEITSVEAAEARVADAARPRDVPRVFSSSDYALTDADVAAWDAAEPTTEGGWLDRALALSRINDYPGALAAAERAVALAPQSSAAWANQGVYRFWTGDLEGAASDLEKAVDIDPSERIAMNGHALLAMADNRYQDAVVEMSRALRQAPKDSFALSMRARAYMQLQQPERALRDIDAMLEERPDNPSLQLMRIGALVEMDRLDEAGAAMAILAEAHPEDQQVTMAHAVLLLKQDKAQEASDLLERVIAASPDDILTPQLLQIEASIKLNQLDAAQQQMSVVRSAHARNAVVLNNLCWTAATQGVLLEQALKDCEAALALAPTSAGLLDSKGRVLLQMGDTAGALAAYDAALAETPELAASLYGRGLARIALGASAEGEADKAAAVRIQPDVIESFTTYPPPVHPQPEP